MSTNVKKKSTAGNSKFSYKYTDLATIHEAMEEQGIAYYQFTRYDNDAQCDYIYTVIKLKDAEKPSDPIRGAKIVEGKTLAGGNSAQEYGSALTYARRYSLLMALGWATEDDDAASVTAGTTVEPIRQAAEHTDRLDFDKVKEYLSSLQTIEQVDEAKVKLLEKYPKMTEKQRGAVNRIFADRKDQLSGEQVSGWIN